MPNKKGQFTTQNIEWMLKLWLSLYHLFDWIEAKLSRCFRYFLSQFTVNFERVKQSKVACKSEKWQGLLEFQQEFYLCCYCWKSLNSWSQVLIKEEGCFQVLNNQGKTLLNLYGMDYDIHVAIRNQKLSPLIGTYVLVC